MASNAKKKTTMAKLARESRLRQRRQEKQARKEARKQAAADGAGLLEAGAATAETAEADGGEVVVDEVVEGATAPADA